MDYSTQLPCPSVSYGICSNLCPIQPSCPLSPPSLPALIFPNISVFSNESTLRIRWPKYWSFGFSISTYKKHSGLISFRIDWLNFLAVQGILKSLLQHHNSKASILQCSVKTSSLGYNHKIQQKNVLQKGENSPNLTNADKHQERRIW